MDKRVGAQFFTIRESCQQLSDFEASCRKVSEIGYKTVQLSGIGDFKASDIKKVLDKYLLEAVCTHKSASDYTERLESTIKWHKDIGCRIAGIGALPGLNTKKENVKSFVKTFNHVADEMYKNGLIFAYHNHQVEFNKMDGQYVFDYIAGNTEPEKFRFILDVYWLSYSGINPAKFIRRYKDRIVCVHLKDMGIIGREICMFEIGCGNVDWDDVLAACEEANVQYALVEQDICRRNPFESLKISYDYLKRKGFC